MRPHEERRPAETGKLLRVRDFLQRDGVAIDSPDDRLSVDDTLVAGEFLHQELRNGLFVHVSNVVEQRPFTATSHIREGLSCIFFMNGEVDLDLGGRRFKFGRRQESLAEGTAVVCARPESFERLSRGAQQLRHLVVSASPEWMNLEALERAGDERLLVGILKDHLAHRSWRPTPKAIEIVRQMMMPSAFVPSLRNLYLEGRAIEVVGETLSALMKNERREGDGNLLSRQNRHRLERAKGFIAANLDVPLTVGSIAQEAGLNASGLQNLFRAAVGMSIFEYVRTQRLERAFAALASGECTISDASLLAGYSSPANFATAFRRQFGMAPSDVRGPARRL